MAGSDQYLVLEARFLAGTYGGTEWPPSPFRLLQAIVAGCRSIEAPGLDWLERQAPPQILATDEPAVTRFRRSIPNNADPRKPQAALSLRQVVQRRVSDPVRYCYALRSETDRLSAERVITSAAAVHTLGTGEDMCAVQGIVAASPPESAGTLRLWAPAGPGSRPVLAEHEVVLRCPVPGSLASLEERFQQFQHRLNAGERGFARPVSAPALHATVVYAPAGLVPRTAAFPFRFVVPDGSRQGLSFPPSEAVVIAGRLRHVAMRVAAAHCPELADFAAGYGPEEDRNGRMSWVPLPSIGHRHADGLVRRGLWLARASDAGLLGRLVEAVGPDGVPLVDEATGGCIAMAQPVDAAEEPVLGAYLARARRWDTVTPVILPADYDRGNLRVMTRLAHKAVREAGIDPGLIASVEFSKTGFSRQAVRIQDLRLKEWSARHLILYHLRLTFVEAIRGPIVLGRGRHFGLGLLCANPE